MKRFALILVLLCQPLIGCNQTDDADFTAYPADDLPLEKTITKVDSIPATPNPEPQRMENNLRRLRNPFVPISSEKKPKLRKQVPRPRLSAARYAPFGLKLQGIIWGNGTYRAVINGRAYRPGEESAEFRVLHISRNGVVLYHKRTGQTVRLSWQPSFSGKQLRAKSSS